ncbi:MAG: DUF1156 domain-containing protein [Desulfovibrio sp.]|nr:DUF1156 domain-containing protein [Desulfovibrio sp.]
MPLTRRLIEEWLPIAELSEESVRERHSMTALPPIYYLHVWWARRPLVASRAAVLASLLPADADRDKFLHALGIHGDPVAAKVRIARATQKGIRLGSEAYGYPRAFGYLPSSKDRDWFTDQLKRSDLDDIPTILDPTAGGGSIPFESVRVGANVFCNDLNPVASLIESLTIKQPLFIGSKVYNELKKIGLKFIETIKPLLQDFFPPEESENLRPDGYLFARTIRCPYCKGLIPLSPNWRLTSDGTGVKLIPNCSDDPEQRLCSFAIVTSAKEQSKETVKGGTALCPYPDCGHIIEGETVKSLAQAGEMGEQLYAVVYKKRIQTITKSGKKGREKWIRGYRAPRPEDNVFDTVKTKLEEKLPEWEALDIVPTEAFPSDSNDDRPIQYGMPLWRDLFSPRQLYCHCTSVEVFRTLLQEEQAKPTFGEVQKATFGYLALALDKLLNYNSRMSVWMSTREVVANTFNRHDFAFCWSYAEMAPLITGLGYDWAIEQTGKCLLELIDLLRPDIDKETLKSTSKQIQGQLFDSPQPQEDCKPTQPSFTPPSVTITCKSADNLDHIEDASVDAVVMDPPYYDNVMYAELSDFFYVWLKRTAGYLYPELFTRMLTDKENEAVANPAKFQGEKHAKDLAYNDYRTRMGDIFTECHRVLKKDGILTLMFTHKATGAWDALAKGLMDAGFVITASWPINTEAEGSLHIKDKAAANSTIFLVCRPREEQETEQVFWEELELAVRKEVVRRIEAFQKAGIFGIDLYLASFGPALEVLSKHWPVKRGQPNPNPVRNRRPLLDPPEDPYAVTPEDVLATARSAVKQWRLERLTETTERRIQLDPLMEWFVLAWDTFHAPQFEYDEALGLARVCGVDLDKDIIGRIAEKKASSVILWDSLTRAAKATLGSASGSASQLDTLHHVCRIAHNQNLTKAKDFLEELKAPSNPAFVDALTAVLEVLPVSKKYTGADLPKGSESAGNDFEALEDVRKLLFADKVKKPVQLSFYDFEQTDKENA